MILVFYLSLFHILLPVCCSSILVDHFCPLVEDYGKGLKKKIMIIRSQCGKIKAWMASWLHSAIMEFLQLILLLLTHSYILDILRLILNVFISTCRMPSVFYHLVVYTHALFDPLVIHIYCRWIFLASAYHYRPTVSASIHLARWAPLGT